jgi:DnaJ-domain-containing protein 1
VKPYFEKRERDDEIKKSYIKIAIVTGSLLIILFVINHLLVKEPGDPGLHPVFYILFVFISILIANYNFSKKGKLKITKEDKEMIKVFSGFLKLNGKDIDYSEKIILFIFKTFDEEEIKTTYQTYARTKTDVDEAVRMLSKRTGDVKMFTVYTLFDICMIDGLYSKKDEIFIEELRKSFGIPDITFKLIKYQYKMKGMIEESAIHEPYSSLPDYDILLPYEACQLLGVQPGVSKSDLKKAYHKCAQKFHPDKFYGKSPEVIKQAEEKFEAVKKAYETVLKYLN